MICAFHIFIGFHIPNDSSTNKHIDNNLNTKYMIDNSSNK